MEKNQTGTAGEQLAPGEKSKGSFEDKMYALKEAQEDQDLSKPDGTLETKEQETKEEANDESKESEKDNWADRYKHLQAFTDKQVNLNEQLAVNLVNKDPEAIHSIAETDPKLADKIVAKNLGESHGIKSYKDLVEAIEKTAEPQSEEDNQPNNNDLEERLKKIEGELQKKEIEEANKFLQDFQAKNPEFDGDVKSRTLELFEKNNLPFEKAFAYAKFEILGDKIEKKAEENAYKKVLSKDLASSFGGGSVNTSTKSKPTINKSAVNFLEGIGAKKTLSKYS